MSGSRKIIDKELCRDGCHRESRPEETDMSKCRMDVLVPESKINTRCRNSPGKGRRRTMSMRRPLDTLDRMLPLPFHESTQVGTLPGLENSVSQKKRVPSGTTPSGMLTTPIAYPERRQAFGREREPKYGVPKRLRWRQLPAKKLNTMCRQKQNEYPAFPL